MARPRKDEGRDTRQDILDRALELFAAHGFAATSMRDIARAVGVRESALYHHFPSKDAILEALLTHLGPGAAAQITAGDLVSLLDELTPLELLHRMVDMLVMLFAQDQERRIFRVMLAEGGRRPSSDPFHPANFIMQARQRIGRFFAVLVERGHIRPVDPDAATLAFMAPLMVIRMSRLISLDGPPDLKTARDEAHRHVDLVWKAFELPNVRSRKVVR